MGVPPMYFYGQKAPARHPQTRLQKTPFQNTPAFLFAPEPSFRLPSPTAESPAVTEALHEPAVLQYRNRFAFLHRIVPDRHPPPPPWPMAGAQRHHTPLREMQLHPHRPHRRPLPRVRLRDSSRRHHLRRKTPPSQAHRGGADAFFSRLVSIGRRHDRHIPPHQLDPIPTANMVAEGSGFIPCRRYLLARNSAANGRQLPV